MNYLFFLVKIRNNNFKLYDNLIIFLFNNSINKMQNKKTLLLLSDFIPFLSKGGNNFKNSVLLFNTFSKFYKMSFNPFTLVKFDSYKYSKEFFYNFFRYTNYNNINYLLTWIFSWAQPMFCIECSVVPKKYRRKLKKKYLYKIKYLNKVRRVSKVLNWIVKYSNTLKNFSFINRQLLVYLDLLLNYKNSYVYNKKLLIYKKIFKV